MSDFLNHRLGLLPTQQGWWIRLQIQREHSARYFSSDKTKAHSSSKFLATGPEVQGKYSADLFVQRAQTIFKAQQKARKSGRGADDMKPWFTYLSFQSVHDPLQVRYPYMSGLDSVRISIPVLVQVTFGSSSHQEVKILFRTDMWSGPDEIFLPRVGRPENAFHVWIINSHMAIT